MAIVLLEIGVEEMPAAYLPPALAQLAELARARLEAERIAFAEVAVWGTPRRITLYVTDAAAHQAPAVREVRGPAAQAAFTASGEPTQAAIGFARSQGVPVNELRIKAYDGAEYVVAVFRDEGRPTAELLPALFAELIGTLVFPKTMRWGTETFRFARPIRWLVALMDEQVVPVRIDGVDSGRLSRGHRFLSPGEVSIPAAADYRRVIDENHVLIDPAERRQAILAQLEALAAPDGARIVDDGSLLETTTFQLEYPTAVRCAFAARFLSLPADVLKLVLRQEQHFFPLAEASGALLPAFIGVRNGDKAYLGAVREGYEAVAHAKLLDALFFYDLDRRTGLPERVEALRGVTFLDGMGTLHDKVMRLQRLAGFIADSLPLSPPEREVARRAALLCKADLVTALVTEHPELQGVMGKVYALDAGEPAAVAEAIGEQYLPRAAGEPIPVTPAGRAVALADRLDTLATSFAAGLVPTGSEDPYGLRREAMGAVRTLAEANWRLPLSELVHAALALLPDGTGEETATAVLGFLHGRVETLLRDAGMPPATARAALAAHVDVPADALRVAELLQERLREPAFAAVVRGATRLANIAKHANGGEIAPDLLVEPAERDLYALYRDAAPQAQRLAVIGDYPALLALLVDGLPAIDRFFAEVLVMADDPALRQTRLALAARLSSLFRLLADFTGLGV